MILLYIGTFKIACPLLQLTIRIPSSGWKGLLYPRDRQYFRPGAANSQDPTTSRSADAWAPTHWLKSMFCLVSDSKVISGKGSDCICCDMKREAAQQLRKLPELCSVSSVRRDQSAYFQCLLPPPQIPAINYYKPPSQLGWLQLRLSSERAQQDSPRMPQRDFTVVNKSNFHPSITKNVNRRMSMTACYAGHFYLGSWSSNTTSPQLTAVSSLS